MAESGEYRRAYRRLREAQEEMANAEQMVEEARQSWYSAASDFNELVDSDEDLRDIGVTKVEEGCCYADECYREWDSVMCPEQVSDSLTELEEQRAADDEEEDEEEVEIEQHGDIKL